MINPHTVTQFTPVQGLIGGLLIGLSAALWLWLYGRVAGISGILGRLVLDRREGDRLWRLTFLVGLVLGAAGYMVLSRNGWGFPVSWYFPVQEQVGWLGMAIAGLLVGFGTRMGNGCTSGHGVCGMARLSKRSIVATMVFMAFGFITVFIIRHVWGI